MPNITSADTRGQKNHALKAYTRLIRGIEIRDFRGWGICIARRPDHPAPKRPLWSSFASLWFCGILNKAYLGKIASSSRSKCQIGVLAIIMFYAYHSIEFQVKFQNLWPAILHGRIDVEYVWPPVPFIPHEFISYSAVSLVAER